MNIETMIYENAIWGRGGYYLVPCPTARIHSIHYLDYIRNPQGFATSQLDKNKTTFRARVEPRKLSWISTLLHRAHHALGASEFNIQ